MRAIRLVVLAAALTGLGAAPAAAQLPIGDQFRVSNAGPDGNPDRGVSRGPAVAYNALADEYLVVWSGEGLPADDEFEIFGQRLSATGAELGGDFRISTTGNEGDPDRRARNPAVAVNSHTGEYLVVWEADGLATDNDFEVFGQRVSAAGDELGGDFRISTNGPEGDEDRRVEDPAVTYNAQAREYLVVWEGDGQVNDNEYEISGQRLSEAGGDLGGDFRISNAGPDGDVNSDAINPDVAHNSQVNEYLVAWNANDPGTDAGTEIFGQRLTAAGADLGGDFRISTTGADDDPARNTGDPAIAVATTTGEYLVAWESDGLPTDDEFEVFGQRLSATGADLGGDFRISTTGADGDTSRSVEDPAVAFNVPANEYLVVWEADDLPTDDEFEVFGRRLSATGAALGDQFRISSAGDDGDTEREVEEPAVAANPQANEYLVAWQTDSLPTDDEFEVFARRSGGGPLATADTVAPTLSGLRLSRKRFRVGRKATPRGAQRKRRRAKAGTTIRYRLSEAAQVTFAIERILPGRIRRVQGRRRCVRPTRALVRAGARRCKRFRRAGTLTRQGITGPNSLAFSGRVGRKPLRRGRHRLTLRATDPAGNSSRSSRRRFTVVRR